MKIPCLSRGSSHVTLRSLRYPNLDTKLLKPSSFNIQHIKKLVPTLTKKKDVRWIVIGGGKESSSIMPTRSVVPPYSEPTTSSIALAIASTAIENAHSTPVGRVLVQEIVPEARCVSLVGVDITVYTQF
ncbi:hypothetical protein HAX54_049761 [Datura stramonium]|uniref:Uncharacterized protein n=1 Tax=Datura stramonium TaxID=4076 RepID=A0ABS8SVX3_DATST|nr:hypothetical protein [Datura stramonium]